MKPTLAKITRPNPTAGVLHRKRLFRFLDCHRKQPVVWVSGPPGSGKTTLISSYLETRKLTNLWYQVDAGDSDIASFFYYTRSTSITRFLRNFCCPVPGDSLRKRILKS